MNVLIEILNNNIEYLIGLVSGAVIACSGVLIDHKLNDDKITHLVWRFVREEFTFNFETLEQWENNLTNEIGLLETGGQIHTFPPPKFKVRTWEMIFTKLPPKKFNNQTLLLHLRIMNNELIRLNDSYNQRLNILNSSKLPIDNIKSLNKSTIEYMQPMKKRLKMLEKEYGLALKINETAKDEKNVFKKCNRKEELKDYNKIKDLSDDTNSNANA
ncbi:hypothetical protein [Alkalicoccus luteus]|uniref:Uncharacterized protein n=1 Tax=Alkalicoccus luteus TaxID=1237094 RepID=A0A969PTT3_9BACI|nr:hypothetical protein [Alkalicoccus luteus]NJP39375.1 hypothetical protein [Alkalicoccus luteus]